MSSRKLSSDLALLKNWNTIQPVHPFADTNEQDHKFSVDADVPYQRALPNLNRDHSVAVNSLTDAFSDLVVVSRSDNKEALGEDEDFFGSPNNINNNNNSASKPSSFAATESNFVKSDNFLYSLGSTASSRVSRKRPGGNTTNNNNINTHEGSRQGSMVQSNRSIGNATTESSNGSFIRVQTEDVSNLVSSKPAVPASSSTSNSTNNSKNIPSDQEQSSAVLSSSSHILRSLPACVKSSDKKLKFLGEYLLGVDEEEESGDDLVLQARMKKFFNLHDSFPFSALISALAKEEDDIIKEATASARGNENAEEQTSAGGGLVGLLRSAVSQNKNRFQQDGFDLDLTYITPRIIAMGFPSSGAESFFRNPVDQVESFFKRRHYQHYRVYNLCSERQYDNNTLEGRWKRFPFDDHNAPAPIKLVPAFVSDATKFLRDDPKNVVAIHCKAGKGRTGLMIACLLMALVPSLREPSKALHYFASQRTDDAQGVTIASQIRYVHYFGTMITKHGGDEPLPHRTLSLQKLVIWSPIRLANAPLQQIDNIFIVVEENGVKILDSLETTLIKSFRTDDGYGGGVHYVFERSGKMPILPKITGDIRVGVHVKTILGKDELFHYWFNTTMCNPQLEIMSKFELDKACKDKKNQVYCEELMCQTFFVDVPVRKPQNYRALIAPPAPKNKNNNTNATTANAAGTSSGQQQGSENNNNNNNNSGNSNQQNTAASSGSNQNQPQQQQQNPPPKQEEKSLFARLFGK